MLSFTLFCRIFFALSLIISCASSDRSNAGSSAPQNNNQRVAQTNDCSRMENGIDMCNYLTNEEMEMKIRQLQQKYPRLVKIGKIGKSTLGVDLTYLKITSNKASERLKPKFK